MDSQLRSSQAGRWSQARSVQQDAGQAPNGYDNYAYNHDSATQTPNPPSDTSDSGLDSLPGTGPKDHHDVSAFRTPGKESHHHSINDLRHSDDLDAGKEGVEERKEMGLGKAKSDTDAARPQGMQGTGQENDSGLRDGKAVREETRREDEEDSYIPYWMSKRLQRQKQKEVQEKEELRVKESPGDLRKTRGSSVDDPSARTSSESEEQEEEAGEGQVTLQESSGSSGVTSTRKKPRKRPASTESQTKTVPLSGGKEFVSEAPPVNNGIVHQEEETKFIRNLSQDDMDTTRAVFSVGNKVMEKGGNSVQPDPKANNKTGDNPLGLGSPVSPAEYIMANRFPAGPKQNAQQLLSNPTTSKPRRTSRENSKESKKSVTTLMTPTLLSVPSSSSPYRVPATQSEDSSKSRQRSPSPRRVSIQVPEDNQLRYPGEDEEKRDNQRDTYLDVSPTVVRNPSGGILRNGRERDEDSPTSSSSSNSKVFGGLLKNGADREMDIEASGDPRGSKKCPSRDPLARASPVPSMKEDAQPATIARSPSPAGRPPSRSPSKQSLNACEKEDEEIIGLTMSDEEFQENYLGNIPAHQRQFVLPQYRQANTLSPTAQGERSFLRSNSSDSGKSICFDFTNEAFDDNAKTSSERLVNTFSALPPRAPPGDAFNYDEEGNTFHPRQKNLKPDRGPPSPLPEPPLDKGLAERYQRARRFSMASLGSRASPTGSEISLSKTVAAHVRRDSIAIFSDKLHRDNVHSFRKSALRRLYDLEQLRAGNTELTKKQIAEKYRVHIFTMVVFVCACLFVGLGWYYKDLTRLVIMQSQKIFLDQGNRVLALAGDSYDIKYQMLVGRNLPPLQLPLHCPELDAGPSRECLWREEAVLRVRYERPTPGEGQSWDGVHCYRVSWQSLHHSTLPEDCFELQQESTQWYGPSNQSAGVFPVKGTFDFVSSPYHLGNAGVFSSAVELYWLSSKGVGILVNASDPVTVHWNSKVDNHVCVVSNYTGPLFGRSQRAGRLPTLNYTVCVGPNPVTTHLAMRAYARQPDDVTSGRRPSDVMFTYPQWSLSGLTSKADYNQSDVLHALEQLKNENMACDLLHLDGEWQRYQGDLTFDSLRFPELSRLADTVRNASCGLGIQLSPFFDYRADSSFYDGVVNSHFVKDAGGQVPGLVQVRQGAAAAAAMAVLDVSSANARVWFNIKVKALSGSLGGFPLLRSIGLSLGENGWLPYKPTLYDDNVTFWQLRRLMSEMAADLAVSFTLKASTASSSSSNTRTTFAITSSITGGGSGGSNSASISTSSKSEAGGLLLSHTAGSQTSPAFIAIVAEVVQTELAADGGGEAGTTLCLSGLVERALTLGLMGYAYVMADGVQLPAAPQPQPILQQPSLFPSLQTPVQGQTQGLSQSQSQSQAQAEDHSRELLLRWMQVAAFFPAARFNVGPWRHGNESVSMAANLSRLHKEVVLPILASKEMRNDVENKGLPILRPTWWLEPAASGQESLQQVLGTQFLLGNDLLVAPVLCVGQTRRSIYVPEGVWSDPLRGKMIEGPTLLKNYRVGLHEIPYFARAPLWEEEPADNH